MPRAALVVDHRDGEALARDLDVLEADLEREHPALLERGWGDHGPVEASIVAPCRIPPHHVRAFLRVYSHLMSHDARSEFVQPVSGLARFQYEREVARHCGNTDVLHEGAVLPAEERAHYFQEECGLPQPFGGYAVVLYHYLVDAGVDPATSLRAVVHYFDSPLTIPLDDAEFLAALPAAGVCHGGMFGGIVVRLTREGATLPTHERLPIPGGSLTSSDAAEFREWLRAEVDRECSDAEFVGDRRILLIADGDVPVGAVAQVVALAPAETAKWIVARDVAPQGNAFAFHPVQDAYERARASSEPTTTAELLTAMDRELVGDEDQGCHGLW